MKTTQAGAAPLPPNTGDGSEDTPGGLNPLLVAAAGAFIAGAAAIGLVRGRRRL